MQLNVTGHHVDLTDALHAYVEEKIGRLERHFEHITNIHVVLTVDNVRHHAEATAHIKGGEIFAEAQADDLYAAIDALVDKLDRQIIKHKEKVLDREHRAAARQ